MPHKNIYGKFNACEKIALLFIKVKRCRWYILVEYLEGRLQVLSKIY